MKYYKILWNEIKQEIYKQMVLENFEVVNGQILKENVIITSRNARKSSKSSTEQKNISDSK